MPINSRRGDIVFFLIGFFGYMLVQKVVLMLDIKNITLSRMAVTLYQYLAVFCFPFCVAGHICHFLYINTNISMTIFHAGWSYFTSNGV